MEDTLSVVPSLGRKIIELRDRRAAKEIFCALIDGKSVEVEPIIVDCRPLVHGRVDVVIIGGFGPDETAPPIFDGWRNSDFAGGVYLHPRFPNWYVREAFETGFKSLVITKFLEQEFMIEFDKPVDVLRMISRIYG